MGTSKRYAAHFDALGEDRHLAALAAKGGLQTLSKRELALDCEPLTVDPNPRPVLVWVRFFAEPVRIRAWACRWTPKAVGVKFHAGGTEYTTWVWADAVDPDPDPRKIPDEAKYGRGLDVSPAD